MINVLINDHSLYLVKGKKDASFLFLEKHFLGLYFWVNKILPDLDFGE